MSETLEHVSEVESGVELKFVRFQLGEEQFAFPVNAVTGIINWREVTPFPNVEDHLLGLGNLRGRTLPVSDLRLRIGIESSVKKEDGLIVVAEGSQSQVGLLVDNVLEVLTVFEHDIQQETAEASVLAQGIINGIVNVDDVLVSIVNIERLVEVAQ